MKMDGIEDVYELSPMQQGMLFHTLYASKSDVYFDQYRMTLAGPLDLAAFRRAWESLIDRHPALRTSFHWEDIEKPVQVVHRRVEMPYAEHDWRGLQRAEQRQRLEAFLCAERGRGFELGSAPLMRLALFRTANDEHELVWSNHHLVLDGWSRAILFKEALDAYDAARRGEEPVRSQSAPYRDFIAWLRRQDARAAESFWRRTLAGFTAPTPLTGLIVGARPTTVEESYGDEETTLSRELTAGLQALARSRGLTPNTLMQGAWALLLSHYSGERDVVFGATVSGRAPELPRAESIVGPCINTLPVRVRVNLDESLPEWLKHIQQQQLETRQYEYSSLVEVQGWSEVPRGARLFDSILVFENYPVESSMRRLETELRMSELQIVERTNYALTLMLMPGEELKIHVVYDLTRLDRASIRRMLAHFEELLAEMLRRPEARVSELTLNSSFERRQLREWNDTAADYPRDLCVHQLFERQARRTPQAVALIFGDEQITYAELDERAEQLARRLRRLGVGPDAVVAILMRRSVEMIVGVVAALKAGGCYLPLDPEYPHERLRFMLADAQAAVLLTQSEVLQSVTPPLVDEHSGVAVLTLDAGVMLKWSDDALEPNYDERAPNDDEREASDARRVTPENLAYLIYTSGSTGRPKGVMMPHRPLVNLVAWQAQRSAPTPRTLQFTSLSFDVSFQEIFATLCAGATLVLVGEQTRRDASALLRVLTEQEVERLFLPFVALQYLAEAAAQEGFVPGRLREVITAGEQLKVTEAVRALFQRLDDCTLDNQYGPTEAHVVSSFMLAGEASEWPELPPIGKPIANARLYVLDERMRAVAVGVAGELYLGGDCLARGYLGRPETTAEKFIVAPLAEEGPEAADGAATRGARLYRTGDVARFTADGQVEFLGRSDEQVKVRGYRVEPGEIESALRQLPGVRGAVVVARERARGEKRLVAYVLAGETGAASADERDGPERIGRALRQELREGLRERLPEYMIPSTFVFVEEFPLTPSGKVNRRALPSETDETEAMGAEDYEEARTPLEEMLAGIWADVLKVGRVGRRDNFFELGGHSLMATRMTSKLREVFKVDLPLRRLFELPTVAELAEAVEELMRADEGVPTPPLAPVARDGALPLSFAQERLWFIDQLEPQSAAYNLNTEVRLAGQLDAKALEQSFDALVRRHESLRTTFAADADGQPAQVISPPREFRLPLVDLSGMSDAEQRAEVRRLESEKFGRPFDLERGPLMRVGLLKLGEDEHLLVVTMHHIISDGWSLGVLVREVAAAYAALSEGRAVELPTLPVQYADFAAWQRERLRGEALEKLLAYWKRKMSGAPPLLELPTDFPRPAVQSFQGATQRRLIPAALLNSLQSLARARGVTMFMLLLAAFQILLHRYAKRDDIVVGTDIANRNRTETEDLIGFFINMLVMRADLAGDPAFTDLLAHVRESALDAYAHQDLPLEKLVEELRPERSTSYSPLFQIVFVLQNTPAAPVELPRLTVAPAHFESETVRFDLSLMLSEGDAGLHAMWRYRTDLFRAETVETMHRRFETLLASIAARPEARLSELEWLSEDERREQQLKKKALKESGFKKFKSLTPKAVSPSQVKLVETSSLNGAGTLPLVLRPKMSEVDLTPWARDNREFIEAELLKHGALLFRGFRVKSVAEFSEFARAFSTELMHYGEPSTPRSEIGDKVYTSTEYPPDQSIPLHNEMSYSADWPMKVWFYCDQPAARGGATPIADSRKVFELLSPATRGRFIERGVKYVRNFGDGFGLSWQTVFQTTDRAEVEERCRRSGVRFVWGEAGRLRTSQVRQSVARHPRTGETVWFNQAHVHHLLSLEPALREALLAVAEDKDYPLDINARYGDGEAIDAATVEEIYEAYRRATVAFEWQAGDILMVDNMLVAHGRQPFAGPRRIVVAMAAPYGKTAAAHAS